MLTLRYREKYTVLIQAAKRANVTDVTLHTFRHTFASWLVMEGIDINTVRELLGHSDIKTTMKYTHLAPEHVKRAVERLQFSF
jgi:site-specific recombinase XerD